MKNVHKEKMISIILQENTKIKHSIHRWFHHSLNILSIFEEEKSIKKGKILVLKTQKMRTEESWNRQSTSAANMFLSISLPGVHAESWPIPQSQLSWINLPNLLMSTLTLPIKSYFNCLLSQFLFEDFYAGLSDFFSQQITFKCNTIINNTV